LNFSFWPKLVAKQSNPPKHKNNRTFFIRMYLKVGQLYPNVSF